MIRLENVVKEYRGSYARPVRALDGVSLEVPAGSALGLVGPNGAGKSTLIRLLLGYLRPTAGEASIAGLPPRRYVERHGIGYVPEDVAIPPRWTVRGALHAYAALGEVERPTEEVERVLALLELTELAGRRVGALSRGNRQRLALAQALLGPRKLLLLDEPTNALDPVWVARLRSLLADWRAADPERVLLLVSHNLAEMQRVVDRAVVLVAGRIRTTLPVQPPPTREPPAGSLEAAFLKALAAPAQQEAAP